MKEFLQWLWYYHLQSIWEFWKHVTIPILAYGTFCVAGSIIFVNMFFPVNITNQALTIPCMLIILLEGMIWLGIRYYEYRKDQIRKP
jgi:hypothetical protein